MLYINNFNTYIIENQSVVTISIDDMEKLLNDKDNKKNLYDLIKLAQGFVVDINGVKLKLEDVDFKIIKNMIRNSPLNDKYSTMYSMFLETHPKKALNQ